MIDVDELILRLMSQGYTQLEVSAELKRLGIRPNSQSIVDKKLKAMREQYKCKTIFQLMYKMGVVKAFEK